MSILKEYKIVENIELAQGLFELSVLRDFDFIPGQVVSVSINNLLKPRMYSIASGNKAPLLKILYSLKPDGELTPNLSQMKVGEKVYISKPFGDFQAHADKPAYCIATSTGIAPFASMLLSGKFQNKVLIHGVRKLSEFYLAEEFQKQLGEKYIRCCTSEKSVDIYPGRVTGYLTSLNELPKEQNYYLCGSAEMVVETRDLLISKGVAFDRIISEIYF